MKPYLLKIDTETAGNRYDVTPIFADAAAFARLTEDLAEPFDRSGIDIVAGIDALGFILGTSIANRLSVGLVPIRKGGKLPVETDSREFVDYSKTRKRLEIRKDILQRGERVLLVDEWIETGSQVQAASELIERQGAIVAGIAAIQIDCCKKTDELRKKYRVVAIESAEQGGDPIS